MFSSSTLADNNIRMKLIGFPGCVFKVLNKYLGEIISVEAERNQDNELLNEFDIFLE